MTGAEFRDDVRRRRRPLAVEVLSHLTELNPAKSTLAVAETVGILALSLGAAVHWWTPWVVVLAILVIASRRQACFVLAHDAAHYRLYGTRWLNNLVGRSLAAVAGVSMCTYRVVHRLHHNHLNEPQDPIT